MAQDNAPIRTVSLPRIEDEWQYELGDPSSASTMPLATQLLDFEIERQIERLKDDLDAPETPVIADDEPSYLGAEVCALPPPVGKAVEQKSAGRMARHAQGMALITTWLFNGTVAAGVFTYMHLHEVEPCDLLPEPIHTNVCGFTPR